MKKWYKLTDSAGPYVAGRRAPVSGKIFLTPREASYDIILGNLVEYDIDAETAAAKGKAKPAATEE
jgi:hypothetical protein